MGTVISEANSELQTIFNALTRAGGKGLPEAERTIKCDVMDTLFLHRSGSMDPYGNIPLYRLLLAFNEAGAKVALHCDNKLDKKNPDVASFLKEIKALGLSDELLRATNKKITIAAWPKPEVKCGVLIDNNHQGHGHRAHVYFHPADSELHNMQDAAAEANFKIDLPDFMKLAK